MLPCGEFSHDLIDPRDRGTWDKIKLVRCTIVAINPKENTADVELGQEPPAVVPYPELTDIDCPDIPVFDGDGWSDDNKRRKFVDVPIYYHCQGSKGTVAELKTGHLAFNIPVIELTNPPYSTEDVAATHKSILREKALLLFIPPTKEEQDNGIKGYRYVIGHTDRNDISPCKSEYLCIRINSEYDDDPWLDGEWTDPNPLYGKSHPDYTLVTIFDPIGNRTYKGLEQFGITFPCFASAILNKVASITLDENTPLEDIAFLDTLHEITPLYQNAFMFELDNTLGSYLWDPYCHEYYPIRLCWLNHFFDYSLQCTDNIIRNQLVPSYVNASLWCEYAVNGQAPTPWLLGAITGEAQSVNTTWNSLIEQTVYYRIFADNTQGYYIPETFAENTVTGVTNLPESVIHTIQEFHPEVWGGGYWFLPGIWVNTDFISSWYVESFYTFSDTPCISNGTLNTGFFVGNHEFSQAQLITISGSVYSKGEIYKGPVESRTREPSLTTWDYTIKVYTPWQPYNESASPYFTYQTSGSVPRLLPEIDPLAGLFGVPNPDVPTVYMNVAAISIGLRGTYGMSTVQFNDDSIGGKSVFSYNPNCWYGSYDERHLAYFETIQGASESVSAVLDQMISMWTAVHDRSELWVKGLSSFVIRVLE